MINMNFGVLLDKLLYLSNQKKSALAKELGYDTSYISKWINSKNLPSNKNINKICKSISDFIVGSLTNYTIEDIINYFEIEMDESENKELFLLKYIEKLLKESYLITTGNKSKDMIVKETYYQEGYNSKIHINPTLRKKYLDEEIKSYLEKNEKLDIIIYSSLFELPISEKIAFSLMKERLYLFNNKENLNIKFLTDFKYNDDECIINGLLLLNMISTNSSLNFKVYNCDISLGIALLSIKGKILYLGVYKNDGGGLITNMSKEKTVADEFYYNLDHMLEKNGNAICEEKSSDLIIRDNTYMEYIMGSKLRGLIGSMSELFMPGDLFNEIAKDIFGEDEYIINKLNKINIFLQNVIYKSELKILIYESEFRKYVSSGEVKFFNRTKTLTFKQRERHIKHIEKILKETENVEVKFIKVPIAEELNLSENPSILLSENIKLININTDDDTPKYAIITDNKFENLCENLFEKIWEDETVLYSNKKHVLDIISTTIEYIKVINNQTEDN